MNKFKRFLFTQVITPFPCVRIFCLYTGTAVAFIYVWHLTFFGGCLALSGYAEKNNRHGLFHFKTTPKSMASNRNWFYRCVGYCKSDLTVTPPVSTLGGPGWMGVRSVMIY